MGKNAARSFYVLGIFVFSLCFTKVTSAPSVPTKNNIIDAMQNDEHLCPMPKFLYDNDITGECRNVTYPELDLRSDFQLRNVYLCLAFYDTWYKYCQVNQSQEPFKDKATFISFIQKFFPGETDSDHAAFCQNIKNMKVSYEKLKSSLSRVNFSSNFVCYTTCLDGDGKFVPLCSILAWSKSIDDDAKQTNKNQETQSPSSVSDPKLPLSVPLHKQTQVSEVSADKIPSGKTEGVVEKSDTNAKASSTNNVGTTEKKTEKNNAVKDVDTKIESAVAKADNENDQQPKIINNANTVPSNSQITNEGKGISETLQKPIKEEVKSKGAIKDDNTDLSAVNTGIKVTGNDANDDTKMNKISQNTQDHENSANQDDWSRIDEDKFSDDPIDEQPMDTADQSQGVPEPSEQRDIISRYHNIRTDEESHFFTYFTIVSLVSIAAYIGYHNKQKILAILLEGRRSRSSRGRRRPSTANYRKLDCTLEEAVTSQCNANVTHVIY